jgi:hypothetical protein
MAIVLGTLAAAVMLVVTCHRRRGGRARVIKPKGRGGDLRTESFRAIKLLKLAISF